MAGIFSKEKFQAMIADLDKDGDGTVDKDEFKAVYLKANPPDDMAEFEKMYDELWSKIDKDGDGNLTAEELATYYGFTWADVGSSHATEMNDDQILEMLKLQATLSEKESSATASAAEGKAAVKEERDSTIIQVTGLNSTSVNASTEPHVEFLQACQGYELSKIKEVLDMKLVNVRIEEANTAETPLHKFARADGQRLPTNPEELKAKEKQLEEHKKLYEALLELTKDQANAVDAKDGSPAGTRFKSDLNHKDKSGKTPLLMAIEFNRQKLILPLIKAGADPLAVQANGWNLFHRAADVDDLQLINELTSILSPARVKAMLSQLDKSGRLPIHIAAYKCIDESEVLNKLMLLGSDGKKKDTAGNTPGVLAEKSGRRRSRDLIDNFTDKKS